MKDQQKVIFFLHTYLSNRDYNRFGFDILKNHGFKVEAWNFLKVISKEPKEPKDLKIQHIPMRIKKKMIDLNVANLSNKNRSVLVNFEDKKSLITRLKKIKQNDLIINLITVSNKTNFVFKILDKSNINYGFFDLGKLPIHEKTINDYLRFIFLRPSDFLFKLYKARKRDKKKLIYNPSFALVGGLVSEKLLRRNYKNIKELKAHSFDYDIYLSKPKNIKSLNIKKNFAVFIDEYNPYHPDVLLYGAQAACDEAIYHNELKSFFEKFEKLTNLEIIIAGHPRGYYASFGKKMFGNRKIIKNYTRELIQHSQLVLAHASTSLNFAVLYKKPVKFINSINYSRSYHDSINKAAKSLSQKPILISNTFDHIDLKSGINENKYRDFKLKFIKSNKNDVKIWNLFALRINSLLF